MKCIWEKVDRVYLEVYQEQEKEIGQQDKSQNLLTALQRALLRVLTLIVLAHSFSLK